MSRPVCPACYQRSVAINYRNKHRVYYRNRCDQCIRQNRHPRDPVPTWVRSGYKLKDRCDLCGFKSRIPEQISVWYIDGNQKNGDWINLRCVCSNCQIFLKNKKLGWIENALKPDF